MSRLIQKRQGTDNKINTFVSQYNDNCKPFTSCGRLSVGPIGSSERQLWGDEFMVASVADGSGTGIPVARLGGSYATEPEIEGSMTAM